MKTILAATATLLASAATAQAPGDPSLVPQPEPQSSYESRERFRIVADLNGDGLTDLALSEPLHLFGNAGGSFTVYVRRADDTLLAVGEAFLHPLAVTTRELTGGAAAMTTYLHGSSACGALVTYRVSSAEIARESSCELCPGLDDHDAAAYADHFSEDARLEAQISETTGSSVTWLPYRP